MRVQMLGETAVVLGKAAACPMFYRVWCAHTQKTLYLRSTILRCENMPTWGGGGGVKGEMARILASQHMWGREPGRATPCWRSHAKFWRRRGGVCGGCAVETGGRRLTRRIKTGTADDCFNDSWRGSNKGKAKSQHISTCLHGHSPVWCQVAGGASVCVCVCVCMCVYWREYILLVHAPEAPRTYLTPIKHYKAGWHVTDWIHPSLPEPTGMVEGTLSPMTSSLGRWLPSLLSLLWVRLI